MQFLRRPLEATGAIKEWRLLREGDELQATMTKRFSTTDLKDRFGYHEFQKVVDMACPYCRRSDLWLEVMVEHMERNSASRAQRLYCCECQTYFEHSPTGENTVYEVSQAFRSDFRQTEAFEPGVLPTRVQTGL